jgi:hypothetical protein
MRSPALDFLPTFAKQRDRLSQVRTEKGTESMPIGSWFDPG